MAYSARLTVGPVRHNVTTRPADWCTWRLFLQTEAETFGSERRPGCGAGDLASLHITPDSRPRMKRRGSLKKTTTHSRSRPSQGSSTSLKECWKNTAFQPRT